MRVEITDPPVVTVPDREEEPDRWTLRAMALAELHALSADEPPA
jgi:hypothetical protein